MAGSSAALRIARRRASHALVIKRKWLDKILAGTKDWEIRGTATKRRGWIHLAESKAGGKLKGLARLCDCREICRRDFSRHVRHHRVPDLHLVPYKRIFAWVLAGAKKYTKPVSYVHKRGAVIWVKV